MFLLISECFAMEGGRSQGNCAAGFGVCCVIIFSDDDNPDINHNETYIQNPDFPSHYGDTDGITYKVNKIDSGN